jgi:C_GCAxxG_C_C family probable redox protein
MNLPEETGLKIACGFGGGMARYSRTCGAVTGGIMAISLKYGKIKEEDREAQEKTYAAVQEFVRRFEEINESSICRELIDFDLNTPEGLNKANESGITKTLCPKLVKSAVEILNDILK